MSAHRQKCPASLSVGTVLYSALFDTNHTGKTTGTIYEEIVRSIRRPKHSSPSASKTVLVTKKIVGLTWVDTTAPSRTRYGKKPPKTEGWASYIPAMCSTRFMLGSDLPLGLCTTRLLAIKAAVGLLQTDIKWYLTEIDNQKKEAIPDEYIKELEREKEDCEKSLRLAKSFLTRERNIKKVANRR